MPCSDGGYPAYDHRADYEREFTHNSTVAEYLCAVLTQLETDNRLGATLAGLALSGKKLAGLQKWWNDHKLRDDQRIAAEKEAQRKKDLREGALSKLTAEERKELGLTRR